jgi:predicted transcriptional regulator of viral defense system
MATPRQEALRRYGDFLRRSPVFTLRDLARVANGRQPRRTALERVKYYSATGRVRRLARELYAVVPPGVEPGRFQPDRFLVARALRHEAVLSHHSALELLGAAHSVWNACTAYASGPGRRLSFGSSSVQILRPPAVLGPAWDRLGVEEVHYFGQTLRVTGPERTLVEGFRQPHHVGGLYELVESAAGFAFLRFDVLREVLAAYQQKALWAAVGWFLERHARTFFTAEEQLGLLQSQRPRSPQYLPRSLRGGVFQPRWNLVLPQEVVRGGEPDETEP